jgi:glyoxylase-like metal-dependent hydrolase (beta-lactamase superfamily II)
MAAGLRDAFRMTAGATTVRSATLLEPARTGVVTQLAPGLVRVVAPNPGPLTGPGTNTYLLELEDGCAVLDPGPDDATHLERILEAAAGAPVRLVLCTHSHPDHSPGAARLRARCGARVLGRPAPDDGYQDESYAPDATIEDGRRFRLAAGRTLRAVHTPGHASNHVCFLLERDRWLFTGDHLMNGSTVVILPPDGSMLQYLASLHGLAALPLECLLPGHGAVMTGALDEIGRVIAHRLKREARVVDALRAVAGPATLDALLPVVYDDTPAALHPLARYSLLAHLLKLREEGLAAGEGDDWSWRGR